MLPPNKAMHAESIHESIHESIPSRTESPQNRHGGDGSIGKFASGRRHPNRATPILMIGSFFAGIAFAVAHHVYYSKLNDTLVGSATKQQWPIRIGTAFAFLVQACFASAVGTAYIQWVWRRFRQKAVQIRAIDAAFSVDRNIFMFLQPGFVSDFPVAAGLVLIFWCMPLTSLVTPATLAVTLKPNETLHTALVNSPSISNADQKTYNIYTPRSDDPVKLNQMFTVLGSTGELLRLSPPDGLQNISYTVDIIVPIVRCQDSDENVRSWTVAAAYEAAITGLGVSVENPTFHGENLTFEVDGINNRTQDTTPLQGQIGYYAGLGNTSITPSALPMNDIWIAIANPSNDSDAANSRSPYSVRYYTCTLRNASVTTNVAFIDNVQSLKATSIKELEFPQDEVADGVGDASTVLYSLENYGTFGSSLYSLLFGFVMNYQDTQGSFGWNWTTTLDQTILGTSKDFSRMTKTWKDGGLGPDATAQNKNLTTLIEEFSLNASWSLMGMSAFNNKVSTQVNQTLWLNKYTYKSENLFIAYGCSLSACLITILVGGYAIFANGRSHDNHFSSIATSIQNPDLAALFDQHSTDASVLETKVARTRIRLLNEGRAERFGIDRENIALNPIHVTR